MQYKRILTIQDISCIGQCSMTVALPILSACGHEICILPTALLSTHTGGFGKPVVVHFDEMLDGIIRHWKENSITFDAVLVGYLGSVPAVKAAEKILDTMLAPGGICIVDPAMADHGRRYSGLTEEYAREMEKLCRRADIMLPNVTEAAMFAGMEYESELTETYVRKLLETINHPCVVLTGVGYESGKTGVVLWEKGRLFHYVHNRTQQNHHGTGDMFAACFTGALMRGKTREQAAKIAADFVCKSIVATERNPAHWYGVKFETVLPELIRMLETE